MAPVCGMDEFCGQCLRCHSSSNQRSEAIAERLVRESMNDCVHYPLPTQRCVKDACALKAVLQPRDMSIVVHFCGDVVNIIVRLLFPRVHVKHLLLPLQPEIAINKFFLRRACWNPSQLLRDYERRVQDNKEAEHQAEVGFALLSRQQYLDSLVVAEELRAQAKRRLQRRRRAMKRKRSARDEHQKRITFEIVE
jgi:hypothetical protein